MTHKTAVKQKEQTFNTSNSRTIHIFNVLSETMNALGNNAARSHYWLNSCCIMWRYLCPLSYFYSL